MNTQQRRGLDSIAVFAGSIVAHFLLIMALLAALVVWGAPVGANKLSAFGLVIVPVTLVVIGWIQGRLPLFINLTTSASLLLEAHSLSSNYDPSTSVGHWANELSTTYFSSSLVASIFCALASAIWSSRLRWKGKDIVLSIPLRGRLVVWPENR